MRVDREYAMSRVAIMRILSSALAFLLFCPVAFAAFVPRYQLNASLSANDGAGISAGDQVTLTLTVTNAGPDNGGGQAVVTATEPDHLPNSASRTEIAIRAGRPLGEASGSEEAA